MDDREQNITTEQKVNKLIKKHLDYMSFMFKNNLLEDDDRDYFLYEGADIPTNIEEWEHVYRMSSEFKREFHYSLKDADAAECLTSKSDYIRGYKALLMENEKDR